MTSQRNGVRTCDQRLWRRRCDDVDRCCRWSVKCGTKIWMEKCVSFSPNFLALRRITQWNKAECLLDENQRHSECTGIYNNVSIGWSSQVKSIYRIIFASIIHLRGMLVPLWKESRSSMKLGLQASLLLFYHVYSQNYSKEEVLNRDSHKILISRFEDNSSKTFKLFYQKFI